MKKDLAHYRNDYPLLQRSKPLSPKAATLEALVISKITPDDSGKPAQVLIDKDTLARYGICDVVNEHFIRDLESLKTQLLTYEVELPFDAAYKYRWRTLISQFDILATDDLRIGVDPDLAPYLVDLQKHFTICDVVEIATLSNQYSKKLYMLLKTVEYKSGGRFTFDEIKDSLGITNVKTYRTFKVFNDKIFKSSIKEINDQSDIHIEWSPVRASRRIVAIEFKITKNPLHQLKLPMVEEITDEIPHEIRAFLDSYGFNDDNFIEQFLNKYGAKTILDATKLFDKRMSNTSIKNKAGLYRLRIHRYIVEVISEEERKRDLIEKLQDQEIAEAALMAEKAKFDRLAKEYAKENREELYNSLDEINKSFYSLDSCPAALLEGIALDIIRESKNGR